MFKLLCHTLAAGNALAIIFADGDWRNWLAIVICLVMVMVDKRFGRGSRRHELDAHACDFTPPNPNLLHLELTCPACGLVHRLAVPRTPQTLNLTCRCGVTGVLEISWLSPYSTTPSEN